VKKWSLLLGAPSYQVEWANFTLGEKRAIVGQLKNLAHRIEPYILQLSATIAVISFEDPLLDFIIKAMDETQSQKSWLETSKKILGHEPEDFRIGHFILKKLRNILAVSLKLTTSEAIAGNILAAYNDIAEIYNELGSREDPLNSFYNASEILAYQAVMKSGKEAPGRYFSPLAVFYQKPQNAQQTVSPKMPVPTNRLLTVDIPGSPPHLPLIKKNFISPRLSSSPSRTNMSVDQLQDNPRPTSKPSRLPVNPSNRLTPESTPDRLSHNPSIFLTPSIMSHRLSHNSLSPLTPPTTPSWNSHRQRASSHTSAASGAANRRLLETLQEQDSLLEKLKL